jgi:hypothetical protein
VFGTGRLFDNNEGPNVKLRFAGFRAIAEGTSVRLDLFAVKPVENNLGFFNDVPNHTESLLMQAMRAMPVISAIKEISRFGGRRRDTSSLHALRLPPTIPGLGSMVPFPQGHLNRPPFISHMFSIAGSNTGAEREVSQGRILAPHSGRSEAQSRL